MWKPYDEEFVLFFEYFSNISKYFHHITEITRESSTRPNQAQKTKPIWQRITEGIVVRRPDQTRPKNETKLPIWQRETKNNEEFGLFYHKFHTPNPKPNQKRI